MAKFDDKEAFVKEVFAKIALRYDFMNSIISLGFDRYWRGAVVKSLGDINACRGLDVCCGTGKLTKMLSQAVGDDGKVVGLDFSAEMLAIAKGQQHEKSVVFIHGNALSLPFPDNCFDFVTIAWGLRNVRDIPKAIAEMTRVLKRGGDLVSLDMAEPLNPFLRMMYWKIFEKIVPPLGKIIAKDQDAYAYLFESVKAFPKQDALVKMFCRAGLEDVHYKNLSLGAVAIVKGTKFV